MVNDAHQAGAECVKFQCHIIEDEMTHAAQSTIPSNSDKSIYEIISRNFFITLCIYFYSNIFSFFRKLILIEYNLIIHF